MPSSSTGSSVSSTCYSAYGLIWQTPFPVPEWRAATDASAPDVRVRYAEIPPALGKVEAGGPLRQVAPGEVRFGLPDVARLLVRDGNEILIEPRPGADDNRLRMLLTGAGSALLLHQRGILPLHASAIQTPAGAVLFMGHSGAGKSTLLNAFLQRGYAMVAEDLAAVRLADDGTLWVEPGVTITKLWADSAVALGQSTAGLARVQEELDKFIVPVAESLVTEAAPLAAIYALVSDNGSELRVEERCDAGKFNALLDHTWQKLVVKRMGLHRSHFGLAATVAHRTPIIRVRRPEGAFQLEALMDALEADFTQRARAA